MNCHRSRSLFAALLLSSAVCSCPAALGGTPEGQSDVQVAVAQLNASEALVALGDDKLVEDLRFQPLAATFLGDHRFDGDLGRSLEPQERKRHFEQVSLMLTRLKAIDRSALSESEQTSYDVLFYDLKTALAMSEFPEHLLPVSQMSSFLVDFPAPVLAALAGGDGAQPFDTPEQYRAFLNRL